jgi:hypothetical protein
MATQTPHRERTSITPQRVMASLTSSAVAPAVVVWVVLGLFALSVFAHGGQALDFTFIGRNFLARGGHASAIIRYDPTYQYDSNAGGYDGQFCYYLAVDPLHATPYIDLPAYRESRILYPMLARLLALGQPALVPYALIVVNWLAVGVGTLVIGLWLGRHGKLPWLALIYGFYPGFTIALRMDLTEPLAYSLAALGVYLFEYGGKRRFAWSAAAFALAGITRESALVFAAAIALIWALGAIASLPKRMPTKLARAALPAAVWLALTVAPYAALKVFLAIAVGGAGISDDPSLTLIPLSGLMHYWPWGGVHWLIALTIALPATICLAVSVWMLGRALHSSIHQHTPSRRRFPTMTFASTRAIWVSLAVALAINTALFALLLARSPYRDIFAAYRVSASIPVNVLLLVPAFRGRESFARAARALITCCAALWLLAEPFGLLTLATPLR